MDVKDIIVDFEVVSAIDPIIKDPLVSQIISLIRKNTGYSLQDLRVKNRRRNVVFSRQLNMFFFRKTYNIFT